MIRKATELIIQAFDEHEVKYRVTEVADASVVEAGFEVEAGPEAIVRFISNNEDNDVAVRIFGLMHRIPSAKRTEVLEACNTLSAKIRFFKFCLDADSSVNVEADLPINTADECVGECCFELFVRIMNVLDNEFHILAEALYGAPAASRPEPIEMLRLLQELRDKPLVVSGNMEL